MCGIIGVAGQWSGCDAARFAAARDVMEHRGPDDAGIFETPGAMLGARRLAIQDLSAAGHQPFVSGDGRRSIAFNGEIYNFPELRRELARHLAFASHTDTEVVLQGYRHWGFRGLLDRIDGMFAFAIWDADRRTLFAARDRAGKKPFFYLHDGRAVYFSSMQMALLAMLPKTPEVSPHGIDAYLVYQAVPAPLSVFKNVRQLPPAHALTFNADEGTTRVERYWSVSYRSKTTESEEEVIEHVAQLARAGVRKRLISDRPVGVFLSGGVDSSIVTALAAEESATPIEAVTLGFHEPKFDERKYARAVAAHVGVRLHEEVLRPELVTKLPEIVWHYGQPLADVSIVPNYHLAEAARRWMVVALNGDGGDELFGGYARPLIERAVEPYRRAIPASVRRRIGELAPGLRGDRLRRLRLLAHAGSMSAADAFIYDRAFRPHRETAYADVLRAQVDDWHPDVLYREAWMRGDGADDADRALAGDFSTYLPDQLLAKADVASMAHGLEARSPLLDTALIEYAARIPSSMRFRTLETKHILKRVAARLVPEHVIYRRKQGFVMPASQWLRGELAPYARAALENPTFFARGWIAPAFVRRILEEHLSGTRDWGEQIFTLLVLEIWARLALDRTLERGAPMEALLSTPGKPPRRTLRTLQLGMEWFPERPGGLNRVYFELIRHLPEAGVAVHGLVAGTPNVADDSEGRVVAFAHSGASVMTRMLSARRQTSAAIGGDAGRLVVSHFALYAWPTLGALRERPFVVHFQGPWGLEGAAEGRTAITVAIKTAVERAVYRRATAFIVLSKPFGKILEERFGVASDRIHVIPGGVDAKRFAISESRAASRARLGWPADRKIVLAVRRLARRMGLDNLVAAIPKIVERVPNVLVLIAGTGEMATELTHRIRKLGVEDHVRLTGFIDERLLPQAYRAADLTVVPSVALEGFGLSVAESLAAGTPCLVTPVGGLPEAVEGLSKGLVLAGITPDQIAAGVGDALTGTLRLPGPEDCARFARENFDWSVIAERVRGVYEGALT
jgi:asparagine synthase (glutamine-hydrolysing)